jgi:hypothetical protein
MQSHFIGTVVAVRFDECDRADKPGALRLNLDRAKEALPERVELWGKVVVVDHAKAS